MFITKTYLYNFDPLKPQFYIVKLGFTGVYIIFLFLLKNIDCGYALVWVHTIYMFMIKYIKKYAYIMNMYIVCTNEYPRSMFWVEIWKTLRVFIWK